MYYIFNKEDVCVASCNFKPDVDDLLNRREYSVELPSCNLGFVYDKTSCTACAAPSETNYEAQARALRDSTRAKIDKFLLPSSTYKDELVSDEQKDNLIQDSLALARWPAADGWPAISFPTLSETCNSFIGITEWCYS